MAESPFDELIHPSTRLRIVADMFERFTADARATVIGAQQHARRLGHRPIGTEHVLRSIVDGCGPAAAMLAASGITADTVEADLATRRGSGRDADRRALASIGIDLDAVLDAVRAELPDGAPLRARRRRWWPRRRPRGDVAPPRDGAHIPFSPRAKRSLELALREALRLDHREITSELLLLGILREGQGLACRMLTDRGPSISELRSELERAIRRTA
jgi:ATP-dependent Clp protease ATP-binding subunit ClpA